MGVTHESLSWEEAENETEDRKSPQHSKETEMFLRGTGKKQERNTQPGPSWWTTHQRNT